MSEIIPDMPAAQYHALPHLSSSLAQTLIAQSPLHAWTQCRALNPNYVEQEKESFDIGSAAHALLLEGQDRMVVVEADDWRTKAAREARDAARADGKHPILARKYQDVMKMRDIAVRALAECEDLGGIRLAEGKAEQVIVWKDKFTDVMCRARLDWISAMGRVVLDYKSTGDSAPASFNRQISRMGYHYQDEFYSQGVEATYAVRPKFVFVVQEITAPYAVSFHACANSLRAVAEPDIAYAIAEWGKCLAANRWPAHSNRIHWAEATPWQQEDALDRADAHGIAYDPAKLWEKAPA